MKKILISLCILLFLFSQVNIHTHLKPALAYMQPEYAKWGRMAMLETKKRYPNASIIDYLHIGRENKLNNISTEKFKLWLKENNREFGVYVTITFNRVTNQFMKIDFVETST